MRISSIALGTLAAVASAASAASASVQISQQAGIRLTVEDDGSFEITSRIPVWTFAGKVDSPLVDLTSRQGKDLAGGYREVEFKYQTSEGARLGAVRVYDHRPVVLFKLTFLTPGRTIESFPSISTYPQYLHHLSYTSVFGGFSFDQLGGDGPWVFFDDQANTFIFSPASHYMNALLSQGANGELIGGLSADDDQIPSGFRLSSVLVIEPGINRAFETWGRFLTDLTGKQRPANDADFSLKYLGYWTDHGARYYYRSEEGRDYPATLLKVRDEFKAANVRLGYVQLDSWFYPKGHEGKWKSADPLGGGAYVYQASTELFPEGLGAFQHRLGLPLITHNRWIDAKSPYRGEYAISGNVSVDRQLWADWMRYLRASGVRGYEQDWLSGPALPARDLASGETFMDAMADAARKEGISLQYCMPLPRHFLQGTRYSNLLTIRTSGDRFEKRHWASFLFNGRLASALGEWPWTDVFMSSERSNLLLSTLSGSIVGIGDRIGEFNWGNLRRAVRGDGEIIKPDDSIAPLDSSYVTVANDRAAPVVASAHTRHAGSTTTYVFAFTQVNGDGQVTFSPAALGYDGPVYAYNYFEGSGLYRQPDDHVSFKAPDDGAYWIIVPIGPSGVGFLGDEDRFISNGRKRIARVADSGALTARVVFAAGESRIRLHGFSRARPVVHAARARIENLTYDSQTQHFHLDLVARPGTSPVVTFKASNNRAGRT
jgi:hypothetical protein